MKTEKASNSGFVYLIGMGPGDPELVTVKAVKAIEKCDVLVYDKLVNPFFLELNPKAELVFVGKVSRNHTKTQDEINNILVELATEGKIVGRLKGGDPFVFGRGGEEAAKLRSNGIDFQVVPGITSAISVPSKADIPITQRGIATSFHVITGHEKDGISQLDWKAFAQVNGTLCFLMGMEKLGNIRENLIREGKSEDCGAAVIMKGTTGFERKVFGTLKDIEKKVVENNITSPAIILIGDVVKYRDEIKREVALPLENLRIALTRSNSYQDRLMDGLRENGALISYVPSIRIHPVEGFAETLAPLDMRDFDGYVFASKEGVERFFGAFQMVKKDVRSLTGTFFAVGKATGRALMEKGFHDGIVFGDGKSSDMVDKINAAGNGKKLLLVTGEKTCGDWHDRITGWNVTRLVAYRTEAGYIHGLDEAVDGVVFMSSSAVRGFLEGGSGTPHALSREELLKTTAICSGKSCGKTASELGFKSIVISERPEAESVLETILTWNELREEKK